ncbi:hypothetical protein VE03_06950 [Pseudogymnoascus sp. 23342-1-I1]|nr:hypothetical protein VE03_06950 [Pseudogymnoascus sp. 23342-1-I1]
MAAETRSTVFLTLIIFAGEPDFIKRRHVGIDCEFQNIDRREFYHIQGTPTEFAIENRSQYNPYNSANFAKSVKENCQILAGSVLETLRDQGYLGGGEIAAAIDGIAGAIAEATEEDQAE